MWMTWALAAVFSFLAYFLVRELGLPYLLVLLLTFVGAVIGSALGSYLRRRIRTG